MNGQVFINATIAFFLALGGSLITLWTGIKEFGEVAPAAYGVAVVGALLSALKDLHSARADSPANIQQANDIVRAAANLDQRGFVRPPFAIALIFASLLAVALSGCQTTPETPRQTLLAAYSTATTVANGIEIAKRDGHITAEQRDAYLGEVKRVRVVLNEARTLLANEPAPGSTNGSEAATKLRFAQDILLSIQAALAQESAQ